MPGKNPPGWGWLKLRQLVTHVILQVIVHQQPIESPVGRILDARDARFNECIPVIHLVLEAHLIPCGLQFLNGRRWIIFQSPLDAEAFGPQLFCRKCARIIVSFIGKCV